MQTSHRTTKGVLNRAFSIGPTEDIYTIPIGEVEYARERLEYRRCPSVDSYYHSALTSPLEEKFFPSRSESDVRSPARSQSATVRSYGGAKMCVNSVGISVLAPFHQSVDVKWLFPCNVSPFGKKESI